MSHIRVAGWRCASAAAPDPVPSEEPASASASTVVVTEDKPDPPPAEEKSEEVAAVSNGGGSAPVSSEAAEEDGGLDDILNKLDIQVTPTLVLYGSGPLINSNTSSHHIGLRRRIRTAQPRHHRGRGTRTSLPRLPLQTRSSGSSRRQPSCLTTPPTPPKRRRPPVAADWSASVVADAPRSFLPCSLRDSLVIRPILFSRARRSTSTLPIPRPLARMSRPPSGLTILFLRPETAGFTAPRLAGLSAVPGLTSPTTARKFSGEVS
uniref:Glutaredoxin domain-containing protein n=1 Tax=Oryza nivara TaxID=4536 RepID=A0A0E0G7X4_ORYNI